MNIEHGISFSSIAGIVPSISTFRDIIDLHGTGYEVEHMPGYLSCGWMYADKSLIRYRDLGLVAVFITPSFNLPPESVVSVAGAEAGCRLRTEFDIHIRMALAEAKEIIEENYIVRHETSDCIEITPSNGESQTFLALHHCNNRIEFIGLHRIQTEESGRR